MTVNIARCEAAPHGYWYKVSPESESASKDECIAYVEASWNPTAQDPDAVAIPESYKQAHDARLDAYRANLQAGSPLE